MLASGVPRRRVTRRGQSRADSENRVGGEKRKIFFWLRFKRYRMEGADRTSCGMDGFNSRVEPPLQDACGTAAQAGEEEEEEEEEKEEEGGGVLS
uniref:Uncharacterized protein n=1 Tax=Knipowitschia caucasica TaxID=637954 RepID=A0AAV2L845_KNICA